jgi:hypothetical protein
MDVIGEEEIRRAATWLVETATWLDIFPTGETPGRSIAWWMDRMRESAHKAKKYHPVRFGIFGSEPRWNVGVEIEPGRAVGHIGNQAFPVYAA